MMLYPPMADLVDKVGSRYMLVNVVAHRARQLAIKEEDPELATGKKPVSKENIPFENIKAKMKLGEDYPRLFLVLSKVIFHEGGQINDCKSCCFQCNILD